mgnify:CR=1 FL=1
MLAQQAAALKGDKVSREISAAVLREVLDSQQQFGQALVEMIQGAPSLEGTGRIVDLRA